MLWQIYNRMDYKNAARVAISVQCYIGMQRFGKRAAHSQIYSANIQRVTCGIHKSSIWILTLFNKNSKKLFRFHFLYPFRLSVKRESSVVIIAGCLLRICSLILSCRSILSWATWLMIHSQSDEDLLSTQSLIYPPQHTMTNFQGNPTSLYPAVLTGLRKTLVTQ